MTFFERFDKLAKDNNTSVNAIAKELGFSSGGLTAWKNGTEPRMSALTEIAKRFSVSVDYLVGLPERPAHPIAQAYEKSPIEIKNIVDTALRPYMLEIAAEPHIDREKIG